MFHLVATTRRRTIRRAAATLAATALLTTTMAAAPAGAQADGPAEVGAWSEVAEWNFIPIHAHVNEDGKLVTYGGTRAGGQGGKEYDIWDPAKGLGVDAHTTLDNSLGTNVFCAIGISDPGGRGSLVLGGTAGNDRNTFTARLTGTELETFDPMLNPRWYGTATTLADGRIVMQGGIPSGWNAGRDRPIRVAEIYEPGTGWRNLEGTRDAGVWATPNYGWWYPKAHLAPNGKIWNLAWDQMYYIDPEGDGAIERLGTLPTDNRGATSASVMYDTGLLLQVGGGERGSNDTRFPGSAKATIIDLNQDPPVLRPTNDMNIGRHWADAVVLPDGKVLVVGGSTVNNEDDGVAYAPEIWDPATEEWTLLAPGAVPRLYHSSAALLPDGSVFAGGGGAPGPYTNLNAEVFYPPYLFDADGSRAARPKLRQTPERVEYGDNFKARTSGPVARVTLIKAPNATHSMSNQIFQELTFTQSGKTLRIDAPSRAEVATPGLYMLHVIDGDGVPSEARMIWLTNDDPVGVNLLTNGSFETKTVADNTWAFRKIPGWTTTRSRNTIEIWSSGIARVQAADGRQLVELNGQGPDTINQQVGVVAGDTYEWTLQHRARAGTDTAEVLVDGEVVSTISSDRGRWTTHTGTFTAPTDATSITFSIRAVDQGGLGNLLDDVSLVRR
ncbi:MAG: galactose oxidase-like domain-containing protein [Actinomycetota bacterium]